MPSRNNDLNTLKIFVIQHLCEVLATDPSPRVRQSIAATLANVQTDYPLIIRSLCKALREDTDLTVRTTALASLRQIFGWKIAIESVYLDPELTTDQPKIQMNFNAPVTGVAGNVEGDFIVTAESQALTQPLTEIQQILNELQQRYPQASEAEASTIIEVEYREIRQKQPRKWQNLLNLKRLWNGSKTAAIRVGEHFSEASPWGKAFVGFLEGISEDAD